MDFKELFINKSKTLIINTDLAMVLSDLNESIVLNQLNYWLEINKKANKHFIDGRYWVYNTYSDWRINNFPYWSEKTIQRAFSRLEKKGIVVSANYNKSGIDKTKWYTIDYDALNKIAKEYNGEQDKLSPRQDNKSYRQDKMTCPAGQNDRAIPENTTDITNNRDYSSEITNINASNSNELEDTINASFSEEKERVRFLDMNNCTLDEIKNHYAIRCEKIAKRHNITDPQKIDDMTKTITYFCQKYYETFGKHHPVLSERALERVFINFCFPPELLYEFEFTDFDSYKELIDRYFKTEYGKYQMSGIVPDYSISHFMSEEILTSLCKNEFGIPHV